MKIIVLKQKYQLFLNESRTKNFENNMFYKKIINIIKLDNYAKNSLNFYRINQIYKDDFFSKSLCTLFDLN